MATGRVVLPVVVSPQPGESFSSWLSRLSGIYGETPQGMIRDALGPDSKQTCQIANPDQPSAEIISLVARRVGLKPKIIETTTLRGRNKLLGIKWRHEIVDTVFSGNSAGWCPDCLSEDGFWHLWWTTPALTACNKHDRRLVRNCPSCLVVPRARQPWLSSWNISLCPECGHDLSDYPEQSKPHPAAKLWSKIVTSANGKRVIFPGGETPSVREFLLTIRRLQACIYPWIYARDDYEKWACWSLYEHCEINKIFCELIDVDCDLIRSNSMNLEAFTLVIGWLFSRWSTNTETLFEKLDPARKRLFLKIENETNLRVLK